MHYWVSFVRGILSILVLAVAYSANSQAAISLMKTNSLVVPTL